ncbi:helix-turn-helix domain-containing protein [Nitrospirillum amazonense]|uniref:helix-turn-helix domain-containing protein n=1 Tax=Nitrospirillum amazonense TaxID=28077 RepID=UPI003BB032E6
MKPYATVVYLVIKAHASFRDGMAFPSVQTIATKAGISRRQVVKSLHALEAAGYLSRERRGRRNHYRVREKVEIRNPAGMPAAVATWDYLPSTFMDALDQLRGILAQGVHAPEAVRLVVIKSLNMNVQINARDGVQTVHLAAGGGE